MPADDIDRLRKDYEAACVAYCDGWVVAKWPDGIEVPLKEQAVIDARSALQAALARQQQHSEDEEAAHHIRLYFRRQYPSLSDYAAMEAIKALHSAGFEVRRKDAT